jgi:hypothetical protein
MATKAKTQERPSAVRIIAPIHLNKVIERDRFFLFVADLLTDLVGHTERYVVVSQSPAGLEIALANHEYDARHPRGGGGAGA